VSFTTPKTWVAGSALTAAEANEQIRDNITYLNAALTVTGITSGTAVSIVKSAGYGVSLTNTSMNIADTSDVAVTFTDEDWDDAGFHSNSFQTARITIPTGGDGRYDFRGWVSYEANGTGRREAWFEVNTATEYARTRLVNLGTGASTAFGISSEIALVAGDYVQFRCRQNSGSSLSVSARFQARRTAV
jgi:hypothetical protein